MALGGVVGVWRARPSVSYESIVRGVRGEVDLDQLSDVLVDFGHCLRRIAIPSRRVVSLGQSSVDAAQLAVPLFCVPLEYKSAIRRVVSWHEMIEFHSESAAHCAYDGFFADFGQLYRLAVYPAKC